MALVHVVILFGTNNTEADGLGMSEREVWRRSVGSRLVLLSRVFYAARYVKFCSSNGGDESDQGFGFGAAFDVSGRWVAG